MQLLISETSLSGFGEESERSLDAERKFQIWRATTSVFVSDALSVENEPDQVQNAEYVDSFVSKIDGVIKQWDTDYDGKILRDIVVDAIEFDKTICMQIAHVYWDFGETEVNHPMDLILCPALRRKGNSSGEDWESRTKLFAEVLLGKANLTSKSSCDIL